MDLIYTARAVGGLLTILVLLVMVLAQFIYPGLELSEWTVVLLLGMIGGLLGVDMLSNGDSIKLTFGNDNE